MATIKKTPKQTKATTEKFQFPLEKKNFLILSVGILFLVAGYVCMAIPSDPDAFLARTLAPILLAFSFLIIIPIGLLYKEK